MSTRIDFLAPTPLTLPCLIDSGSKKGRLPSSRIFPRLAMLYPVREIQRLVQVIVEKTFAENDGDTP
jgi:hypothetical protein